MKISLYQNIKNTIPKIGAKDVFQVLESIKDGTYKNNVASIRIETDKELRNQLKAKLHYVTFCGVFSTRSNSNLKKASGLACLDFDAVDDLNELRELIDKDTFTFSSFVSPSGNGLKVIVKIPLVDNNDDYQDYYVELQKHYDQYAKTDDATKAIANACYLSYDENLYLNNESTLFTAKHNKPLPVKHEVVNIPLTDDNEIADRLDKWFTKRYTSTNRNTQLHAYARQMNAFGVSQMVCEQYLVRYEMSDFKANEILLLIASAYRYTAEFGTEKFEDTKKVKEIENLVISGKNIDAIKNKIEGIDLNVLKSEIDKHQVKLCLDEFWYYTDKDAIKMATYRFKQYLENNKISKYFPDEESDMFNFIKIDRNFISEFGEAKIKDFTLGDLQKRGEIDAFELMANNTRNFSPQFLSMLATKQVKINRDTREASFVYYQNGAVKTTKNDITLIPYDEVGSLVWKKQVIDRNIDLNEESDGEFKTFIWKLSGENKERYFTLKSVIGYLMHSYQNEAKPKAIIFNDEMISEDVPNGGSGKGLIHKAIGQIKNVVVEDGKKFDARGQFAYQKVNKDSQIFLLDDVPKSFHFEALFSVITEGMTVEKKGQDAFLIPFNESPKLSITTNYTVKGEGASHERRIFEVEIANYFNEKHTPEMEFNHQFFSEWNESEWANFDNFMIRCVQFFLKNGLVESNKVNLEFRKFKNNLGPEFLEFMESESFDGTRLNRKTFRDKFDKSYPNLSRYNSAQKFNSKVREYCEYKGLEFNESKFNGVVMFTIGTPKEGQESPFDEPTLDESIF